MRNRQPDKPFGADAGVQRQIPSLPPSPPPSHGSIPTKTLKHDTNPSSNQETSFPSSLSSASLQFYDPGRAVTDWLDTHPETRTYSSPQVTFLAYNPSDRYWSPAASSPSPSESVSEKAVPTPMEIDVVDLTNSPGASCVNSQPTQK